MPIPACVFAQQDELDVSAMDVSIMDLSGLRPILEDGNDGRWARLQSTDSTKPRYPRRRNSTHRLEHQEAQENRHSHLAPSAPRRKQSLILPVEDFPDIRDGADETTEDNLIFALCRALDTVSEEGSKDSLPPMLPVRRSSVMTSRQSKGSRTPPKLPYAA